MKKIFLILFLISNLSAWEINTHRAIDKTALKNVLNLNAFILNSNLDKENYNNEKFEGYDNFTSHLSHHKTTHKTTRKPSTKPQEPIAYKATLIALEKKHCELKLFCLSSMR